MKRLAFALGSITTIATVVLFISARAHEQLAYIDYLKGDTITSIADAARIPEQLLKLIFVLLH